MSAMPWWMAVSLGEPEAARTTCVPARGSGSHALHAERLEAGIALQFAMSLPFGGIMSY